MFNLHGFVYMSVGWRVCFWMNILSKLICRVHRFKCESLFSKLSVSVN